MMKSIGLLLGVVVLCIAACGSDAAKAPTQPDPAAGSGGSSNSNGALPSCEASCPGVLAAKCSHGPVSQDDCVSGCQAIRASKCAAEYAALFQCGGAKPVYSCDANGQVSLMGCDSAAAQLYSCLAKG
jgi:hypothetical protein